MKKITYNKTSSKTHWLLWWKTDEDVIQYEATNYDSIKLFNSYRGTSILCFLFSMCLTLIFIINGNFPVTALFDVTLFGILAFFIYRGHKWALIFSMILWTLEKAYSIYRTDASQSYLIFSQVIWWTIYMHNFYSAFKVERARLKIDKINNQAQTLPQD